MYACFRTVLVALVLLVAPLAISPSGDALAATDPAVRCQRLKLKAAGILARCQLSAHARSEGSDRPLDTARCTPKLQSLFDRAEAKIGAACPTEGDAQDVLVYVGSLVDVLVERVAGRSVCGNGKIEAGEECDDLDLGGLSCRDFGHVDGDLSCSNSCTLDLNACGNGDVCGDAVCRDNQVCRIHEIAIPFCADTCQGVACPNGTECALRPTNCADEPCPPTAQCVPDKRCAELACEQWQECRIWAPTGEAYCGDTCELCEEGETCTFVDTICIDDPCPPIVNCEPQDPCAGIDCGPSAECAVDDATGVAHCRDNCVGLQCPVDEHCQLTDVVCVQAPCPPVAICVPDDPCNDLVCRPHQQCLVDPDSGDAYCADTCDAFDCDQGFECGLRERACVAAPCPPVAECIPTLVDTCSLPAEEGPCRAHIPRWFHNAASGECERFIYGGCGANSNNFPNREACENRCGPAADPCTLEPERGPCQAAIPRWAFNRQAGRCERFVYGGCGGNANNFATREQCEGQCPVRGRCEVEKDAGPCNAVIPRWHYDPAVNECRLFRYGGCGGNENNFLTKAACEGECRIDICEQHHDVGPCDAAIPRWAYNDDSGFCEEFIYGGCGGNDNNFRTQEECAKSCGNPCIESIDPGPCTESIERFAFHPQSGRCVAFLYGGCEGNSNNFATLEQCVGSCGGSPCDLPADSGPCEAAIPRWHYDTTRATCEPFVYGGCGGNDNNFSSEHNCMEACE